MLAATFITLLLLFITSADAHALHTNSDDFDAYPYHVVKKSLLNENRFPKTNKAAAISVQMLPANGSAEPNNACAECRMVIKEIADVLKDEAVVARYKRAVKFICMMAIHRAGECDVFVEGIDAILESMKDLMNDPDRVCHQLHLCGDEQPNLVSRIFLLTLKSLNFEMRATNKGGNPVDVICDECLFMTNEVAAVLNDPAYQNSIEEIMKKICDMIPEIKNECKTTIDAYAPALFQELVEYMANPKQFCEKIGFCKKNEDNWLPMTPLLPANMNPAPMEGQKSPTAPTRDDHRTPRSCLLCEFLVNAAIERAKDETQLNLMEESVMSMCFSLPSEWAYSCVDWVGTYFKPSALSFLADVSAKSVCDALRACDALDRLKILMMSVAERQEAACDGCKILTELARTRMRSPDYQKDVERFLLRLCDKSPLSAAKRCQLTTEMYVKKMNAFASGVDNEGDVCSKLGVCPSFPVMWI